jgi:acetyltransferase-like isoleucine patch superfamily enzyme
LKREIFNFILSKKFKRAGKINFSPDSFIRGHSHVEIGDHFSAGRNFTLEAITEHNGVKFNPRIVIKDYVEIHDFVHIGATHYIEIGNHVLMASRIFISDHNHGIYSGKDQTSPDTPPAQRPIDRDSQVIIEDNVWIGEGVAILPGVRIGKGCVIGANAVVTRDLPPFSIAAGNPARVIKRFNPVTRAWEKA